MNPHCRVGRIRLKASNLALFPGTRWIDSPASRQPDASMIALLQDLLGRAERGEITGIAAAWVRNDGNTSTRWAGGGNAWAATQAGGIAMLLVDYLTAMLREAHNDAPGPSPA